MVNQRFIEIFKFDFLGQPQYFTDFLKYAEFVFLGIFVGEVLLKLFALGYRTYFASKFNRFDCIVIVSQLNNYFNVNF